MAKRLILRTVTGQAKQVLLRQLANSSNNCDYNYLFNILEDRYHRTFYASKVIEEICQAERSVDETVEAFGERIHDLSVLFKILRPGYY